ELGGALALGALVLGALLGDVGLLQHLGFGDLLGGGGETLGLGLGAAALGVRIRDLDLGGVLHAGRLGVGAGDGDALVALGRSGAALPVAVGLGRRDFCLGDGFRGGRLPEGVDVAGGVGDVLHVHVDEAQADFLQLHLDPGGDVGDELVAV